MAKFLQSGVVIDIDDVRVLAAAGRIASARRRTRKGAPKRVYSCVACGQESLGMRAHTAHVFKCPKIAELVPVTDADWEEWVGE
jgi:hypothetical protein